MQYPQDANGITHEAISDNVRSTGDHKLPCPVNPTCATTFRELQECFRLFFDTFINDNSGTRVILLNIIEDFVSVFYGEQRLLELHGCFSSDLRNASARRSMK